MWALTTLNGLGYGQVGPSYESFRRINFVSSYHLQLRAPPPSPTSDSDPLKAEKMSLHVHQTLSFILCTGLR